ncbi:BEM_collapsed_G0021340.mRNA.1.CDS.1 [Saccharomyces cerevisiae]|nr:BEM_collapsed_G0021340.mRNA.1.CDS.1 [Saccharomyces cerevisiae]
MKTNLISSFAFRPHVRFGFLDFGYSLKSILDFIRIPVLVWLKLQVKKKKVAFPTYEDVPKLLMTFKQIMNTYRKGSLGQRQRQRE